MRKVFLAHRFIVTFIFVFSLLSFFPSRTAAQADPPPDHMFTEKFGIIEIRRNTVEADASASAPATAKISGVVINAVTGEPLARALVTIESQQLATLTGSDGHFEFARVRDPQAALSAEKPGFLNNEQMHPENFRAGILSNIVQKGETFIIPLMPAGILTGRVLDSNGEPMEGAVVTPIASVVINGRRGVQLCPATITRKDGVFLIDSLPPGKYFLEVTPRVSLAGRNKRGLPSLESPTGADYPPVTFYPGVTDFSAALALELQPGSTTQADFTLAMTPAFRVSGRITGQEERQYMRVSLVHSSGQQLELPSQFDAKTGAFSFRNVPAGEYRLVAQCYPCSGTSLYGEAPVVVNSRDVKIDLAVKDMGLLNVKIGDGSQTAAPTESFEGVMVITMRTVPLEPLRQGNTHRFLVFAGGVITPNDVYIDPGTYRAEITAEPPFHVESASYGGQNLLLENLVVRADSAYRGLEIVIRRDGATLSGTVQPELKSAGAVLLLPRSPSLEARVARIDKDNRYQLVGVAPGDYDLFAFDQIDNLEYHDPAFLRAYENRGRHVRLRANQAESVPLDLIARRD